MKSHFWTSWKLKVHNLTLLIRDTPKGVLLQTAKTLMKYSIMLHFIRVYTVCRGKNDLQKIYNIFFNYNPTLLDMYNGLSQVCCFKPDGRVYSVNCSKSTQPMLIRAGML